MDLINTIFFSIAGILLVTLIITVGVYSHRLEMADKRIRTLDAQVVKLRDENRQLNDRLNFIRKRYVITRDGVIK